MRRYRFRVLVAFAVSACGVFSASAGDGRWSVIVKGNLLTRTSVVGAPPVMQAVSAAEALELTDHLGGGIELLYEYPSLNLAIGLGVDYLHPRTPSPIRVLPSRIDIPADDGYIALPVEATGYFILPFSSQSVRLFIGGGAGVYFGRRSYSIAGIEAETVDRSAGFGIHVLAGVAYRLSGRFFLQGEMKFRDVQFRSRNRFAVSRVPYNGTTILLQSDPFESRIETDGILLQFGAGFTF